MMKILSRYVLREHLPPFIFAFFIITFVLILETIPRIVDLVVGKQIAFMTVLELIALNLAWMLALSIPMATLVATLSAFGRLSTDMEMLAIKTSGVNLLRLLTPLLIATGILTFLMIQFNDKILPEVNHKARVLMGDIRAMRPLLVFKPGLFVDDIRGYLILLDRVNHETSEVGGVRINDIRTPNRPVTILADHGLMEFVDNGATIKFTLYEGEIHEMNINDPADYRRIDFKKQVFFVTDVGSQLERTEKTHRTDREMNIRQMQDYIDDIDSAATPYRERTLKLVESEVTSVTDSLIRPTVTTAEGVVVDKYISLNERQRDSTRLVEYQTKVGAIRRQIDRTAQQIIQQKKLKNKYLLEIHKKYSIPFACIAFVLFGAPLAILSRRGGMGYAIATSLVLFIIYWAFLIGGESLADRGLADPFWAMWSANFLIGGVGVYLMYVVITEKPIFSFLRRW